MSEFADFSNTERSKGMIKILNIALGEAVTWCPDKGLLKLSTPDRYEAGGRDLCRSPA